MDWKAFGDEVVAAVREHLARETAALREELAELRAAMPDAGERGPQGEPGRDGRDGADGRTGEPGPQGEPGPAGRDAEPVTRAQLVDAVLAAPEAIAEAVRLHLDANPPAPGAKGADGRDGDPGPQGEPGRDGKDAEPVTRAQLVDAVLAAPEAIAEAVRLYLEANPPAAGAKGEDGRDGADGRHGKDGQDGRDGVDGKDGVGVAGATIDRAGELVITLSNGEMRALGPVVGKDGAAGPPGRDGFSLKDFDVEMDADGRTVVLSFSASDEVIERYELQFPALIYRGVHVEERQYVRGDMVTWAGSLWHCDGRTSTKPGEGADGWTLAAKRGRDGRDAVAKP